MDLQHPKQKDTRGSTMPRFATLFFVLSVALLLVAADAYGRGGRGRGGGGHSRGGHSGGGYSRGGHSGGGYSRGSRGGYSRQTPSRSPSMSRSSRSYGQPSRRPSTGRSPARPSPGTRQSPAHRPTRQQLDSFLSPSSPSAGGRRAAAAGGAAGAFLSSNPRSGGFGFGSRQGERSTARDGRQGERSTARDGRQGERSAAREGRQGDRAAQREERASSRPDRTENLEQRQQDRLDRRDQARDQFHDNYPRAEFWSDHPGWARWAYTRPYRWATWGMIATFGTGYGSQPVYYDYGSSIYYEGDTVYQDGEAIATTEEYADQAHDLAEAAPEPAENTEWLPLGVFAVTEDGESSGPAPTIYVQLAVGKQGVIAGTVTNTEAETVQDIEGLVDQKTQRSAWVVKGKEWPVMETGLANLTKDTAPALLHFADGQTQQWLLVRMEEPETEGAPK